MRFFRMSALGIFLLTARAATAQTFTFDFDAGLQGWEGGYSDYGNETDFQFQFARVPLPKPLDTAKYGLKLNGMNRSDDLFMFLRRKVENLAPAARYDAVFKIRLASKYASDGIGIGGSPGKSVFLKAGATAVKPVDRDGRMNIDKGNQSLPGPAMDTLGDVAVGPGVSQYTTIERTNAPRKFSFTTAADGSAWIIIGTDSGFEGLTTLYYQSVEAAFTLQGATGIHGKSMKSRPESEAMRVRPDGREINPGPLAPRIFDRWEPRTRGGE
jgi:hypothetical protein